MEPDTHAVWGEGEGARSGEGEGSRSGEDEGVRARVVRVRVSVRGGVQRRGHPTCSLFGEGAHAKVRVRVRASGEGEGAHAG